MHAYDCLCRCVQNDNAIAFTTLDKILILDAYIWLNILIPTLLPQLWKSHPALAQQARQPDKSHLRRWSKQCT